VKQTAEPATEHGRDPVEPDRQAQGERAGVRGVGLDQQDAVPHARHDTAAEDENTNDATPASVTADSRTRRPSTFSR
jgi:hypothetical protein